MVRRVLAYCVNVMCVENTFKKGAIGSMHNHPHTQITYVASGKFEFTIDGEVHTVSKGDTLLKQDGVMHGCTCLEDGVLIDILHLCERIFYKIRSFCKIRNRKVVGLRKRKRRIR